MYNFLNEIIFNWQLYLSSFLFDAKQLTASLKLVFHSLWLSHCLRNEFYRMRKDKRVSNGPGSIITPRAQVSIWYFYSFYCDQIKQELLFSHDYQIEQNNSFEKEGRLNGKKWGRWDDNILRWSQSRCSKWVDKTVCEKFSYHKVASYLELTLSLRREILMSD
jgi:hypothetical protein